MATRAKAAKVKSKTRALAPARKPVAKKTARTNAKPRAKGIRKVGYVDVRNHVHAGVNTVHWHDCAGGGQVVVQNKVAYVGNMRNPHGTQIIDVKDPKKPKLLSQLTIPQGLHSHKAIGKNGIMLINHEVDPAVKVPGPDTLWTASAPSWKTRCAWALPARNFCCTTSRRLTSMAR